MSGCDGWRHQGFIKAGRTQSQTVPRQWLLRILQRPPYQHLPWGERGRGREREREGEGEGWRWRDRQTDRVREGHRRYPGTLAVAHPQRPPHQHLTWGERGRGRERGREAEGEGGTDIVRGAQTVPREVGRERERDRGNERKI